MGLGLGFLDILSLVKTFPFDSQFWLDLAKSRYFLHQLFWLCKKKLPHYGIIENIAQGESGW